MEEKVGFCPVSVLSIYYTLFVSFAGSAQLRPMASILPSSLRAPRQHLNRVKNTLDQMDRFGLVENQIHLKKREHDFTVTFNP